MRARPGPAPRRRHDRGGAVLGAALLLFATALPALRVAAADAGGEHPSATAASAGARDHAGAAADPAAVFERANADFGAGRYAEAIAGFESILERDGASPALLFNLGNANFRAGRVGPAILSYERALLLAPRDQDVRANLRRAREAADLPAPDEGAWARFVHLLTSNSWAWLASFGLYLACAALVALRLLGDAAERGTARRGARLAALAGTALLVVAGVACLARLRELDRAVVLASDPRLRVAPYASATAESELAPGEIVRIEREHGGFALVRTAQGRSGWMAAGSVAPIAPAAPAS